jgi:hypothetical protein
MKKNNNSCKIKKLGNDEYYCKTHDCKYTSHSNGKEKECWVISREKNIKKHNERKNLCFGISV